MHKKVLSEISLTSGSLSKNSLVENDIVHFHFFNDFALLSLKKKKRNKYNDFELSYHQHHSWILDYIRDKFNVQEQISLIPKTTYGSIHFFGESSLKRNHMDTYDSKHSSDYVVIYMVQGKGDLILEWKDHRNTQKDLVIPIIGGKYVVFSANIDYFFTPNKSTDIRTIITWNCDIIKQ